MADRLQLEIATPERLLLREQVDRVELPGKEGYMGILPGHAPLLSMLGTGFLTYSAGGRNRYLSISGGFVEVHEDHVRVLADLAEKAEEIDVERARRDLERAQQQLITPAVGVDPAEALEALKRAEARLAAADKNSGVVSGS
jgi:F-type H+-transporting ATPase subunit epsilon